MQSAIGKTYRRKLLEFRQSVPTLEELERVRAGLPQEHWPELEQVWREASALWDEEEALRVSRGGGSSSTSSSSIGGGGDTVDAIGADFELTPDEELAIAALQESTLPDGFLE